jgi:Transposase DDE domain group 1
MKSSRDEIHRKTYKLPALSFEDQQLTSFSGLVIFQALFTRLQLKRRLSGCFQHLHVTPIFGHGVMVLLLIMHLLLGYRELRDIRYYQDDPLVRRILGLTRLPNASTLSRALASTDETSAQQLRRLCRQLVLERLARLGLNRITVDFDGSVLSTGRFAEGSAVGFNRKKKGQRSYYPLFCTLAQTGQILDVWHRPGNVHDSNGAQAFILECIREIRAVAPQAIIETRMDSAFFSDEIVRLLDAAGVQYSISVPFERFAKLKRLIEVRRHWWRHSGKIAYFEQQWKPGNWARRARFVFVRQRSKVQSKEPVQLDLFVPFVWGYDFKVIVTNKRLRAGKLLAFHNGRGSQEGVFAELKTDSQLEYVPTRTLSGNQIYLLCAVLAHNLSRELQMETMVKQRATTAKRTQLWAFERLDTLRRKLIQRAGRLTRPQGKLTLTLSANTSIRNELLHYLTELDKAA